MQQICNKSARICNKSCQRAGILVKRKSIENRQFCLIFQCFFCGDPAGIRTPDTLLKRQVLCRLSYWIVFRFSGKMAGMAGLEPANEGVKVPCLTAWLHPIGCVGRGKMMRGRNQSLPAFLKYGVGDRSRTDALQSHNLALYPTELHPPYTEWYAKRDSNPRPTA